MKKTLGAFFLMAFTSFCQQARAGGFQIYEHGASSTGMANARTAVAGDVDCLYFNPAAISELPGMQLQLGVTAILPSIHYDAAGRPANPRQYESYAGGEYIEKTVNDGENSADAKLKLFTPIHLYASYRIDAAHISVGFGLNNPFGLGTYWPGDWDGRFIATETEIQTFFSQPVVAVDLAGILGFRDRLKLSLAVGYDFVYGTARLGRQTDLRAAEAPSLGTISNPEGSLRMTGNGFGHGFNLSVYAELPGLLSFGAAVRSGVSLDFAGTARFSFNADGIAAIDLLGMAVPDETTGRVTINLPWNMNFGLAYLGIDDLVIAADVYLTLFSSYDRLSMTFDCVADGTCSDSLNADPIVKNWGESIQFSLGAQYTLLDSWTVRAGWGLVTSPVPDSTYDPSLPDGFRNLISVGLGYRGGFWGADVGYMLAFWQGTKNNDVGGGDYLNPEGKANGTYKTVSHQLALSVSAWF
jgi:long-chain fatty acid transport protein